MKNNITLFFLLVSFVGFSQSYEDSLVAVRKEHEYHFLQSVLNEQEREIHPSICYFPVDTQFRIKAKFTKQVGPAFVMPMTIERTVYYRKVGILTFYVHDTLCQLNVYQNIDLISKLGKDLYFIPFKDETTARTSYAAGRYMDMRFKRKQKEVLIDFNTAYHPYCAYSDRYSCPIVPSENTIPVAIPAGECYHSHEE